MSVHHLGGGSCRAPALVLLHPKGEGEMENRRGEDSREAFRRRARRAGSGSALVLPGLNPREVRLLRLPHRVAHKVVLPAAEITYSQWPTPISHNCCCHGHRTLIAGLAEARRGADQRLQVVPRRGAEIGALRLRLTRPLSLGCAVDWRLNLKADALHAESDWLTRSHDSDSDGH